MSFPFVAVLDFRSPTLGIRRSPLCKAQPWTGVSRAPIVRRLSLADPAVPKAKQEESESLIDFSSPQNTSVSSVEVVKDSETESLVAVPNVDEEMAKIRAEFSAKKHESSVERSANRFLSSPALWKTMHEAANKSSPQLIDSPYSGSSSDPLLQQWRSPARRNLFTRSDSASAA